VLTPGRTQDVGVLIDRLTLSAGASLRFERSPPTLTWMQLLEGEATLEARGAGEDSNSDLNIAGACWAQTHAPEQ